MLIRRSVIFIFLIFIFYSCRTTKESIPTQQKEVSTKKFYKKYSEKLGVPLTGNENRHLIKELASWLGVPYLNKGIDKNGVDCSGLVFSIYKNVYSIELNRRADDMVKNTTHIDKGELETGDLIFFKIKSDKISHVGIYIGSNKFAHASVSKGVIVSDLNDAYYKKYYFKSGRVKKK